MVEAGRAELYNTYIQSSAKFQIFAANQNYGTGIIIAGIEEDFMDLAT